MKKPWYFYVIVAFSIFVCAIASIVVPIFILTDKAEKNNGQKINEIYEKFSGIELSGDICCATQQNYISCNMKEIHFDYYSINGRTDVIPNAYQSCDDISFCDYVYFTKNYLFFSYEFVYKKTISYLVFKTEWEASNNITFVASFDNIPRSIGSSPNMYDYDKDGFSFYYYYNTQRTDLYRYNVSESTFNFIGSVQDPPDLGKNFFIETSKMKKMMVLSCNATTNIIQLISHHLVKMHTTQLSQMVLSVVVYISQTIIRFAFSNMEQTYGKQQRF